MHKYYLYNIKKVLSVKKLLTIEYLSLDPLFFYENERHPFYEFVYVDMGEIICECSGLAYELTQGDFFLITPETEHCYRLGNGETATIFIVCFDGTSNLFSVVSGKTALDKPERKIVANILSEAQNAFVFPFQKKIKPLKNAAFGSNQLVEQNIENLFILLIRSKLVDSGTTVQYVMNSTDLDNNIVNDILELLKENLYGSICLDYIADTTFYTKTYINLIFKKIMKKSIMQYYTEMKMAEAKKLLKDGDSVVEAAGKLCFDTPNYFSKVFKKYTGMTPTQYQRSIRQ